jgi:iron complex outermembrane receptor protein
LLLTRCTRSEFFSPSASKFGVQGYAIFNGRFGFRATEGLSVNFGVVTLNKDYFEQLLPAGGNADIMLVF